MGIFDKWKNKNKTSEAQEFTLPAEVQQEIEDALHFYVHSGFYSKDDIFKHACDLFEDICGYKNATCPPEAYIKQMVDGFIAGAKPVATNTNNYSRLKNVFDTLNRERIIAIHFAGYTLDDGFDEVGTVFRFMKDNDIPRRGYCFYHQQDIERAMSESVKRLFLAFHSMNDDKQIAVEVGERIVELLVENGFDVEWNHSPDSRIEINHFLWDKVYDGEDYGADRAIRIMSEIKA